MEELPDHGDSKYNGVAGWLLLLCIILTIVGPLLSLSYIYSLLYLD